MIISQNSNDVYYAYTRGRFWHWNGSIWKESRIMTHRFELARAADKNLTPEAFLTSDEFIPMDDYELPDRMLTALREAKPCKNAPIEPVEEEPECAPAASADGSSVSMPSVPSFDFSPLGDLAGAAAEADQQFDLHYGTAQDEYLVSCIYLARIHALTAKAGRYGGGTWTKWYESKGLSEGSARTMVKNGDAFNSATVAELKQLPNLTRKDLNLIARSGCADQVVAAAGDSQRVQDLLAQIKAEKDRATAAEAQRDAAQADVAGLHEQNDHLQRSYDYANEAYKTAEAQRKQAEQRAKTAEDALKSQPITAVVDKEEVRRQAQEMAHQAVQEAREQTAQAQARLDQYQQEAEGLLAPAQACAQQARLMADTLRAMYLSWFGSAVATGCPLTHMAAPLYAVCGQIMSSLEEESTIDPTAAGSVEDAEREALFE